MVNAQIKINIAVGERAMTATLADNDAARALASLLAAGPLTVDMEEYGGFEKVGGLPQSLPASDSHIVTGPGDIMLYQGRNMVIFYGSNSWSYTRLGRIDGATAADVRDFLGEGDVSIVISLVSSGMDCITSDVSEEDRVYDMKGNLITRRPLASGVYIVNGRKTVVAN